MVVQYICNGILNNGCAIHLHKDFKYRAIYLQLYFKYRGFFAILFSKKYI
jgi:hypothetical protein